MVAKAGRPFDGSLTKMLQDSLFLEVDRLDPETRAALTVEQLTFVATAEHLCAVTITDGMAMGLPFRQIYRQTKIAAKQYAASRGYTELLERISGPELTDSQLALFEGDAN